MAKRELRKMLFYLIRGIKVWENDFSHVPEILYKGHMLLIKNAAMSSNYIPNNLYDLIQILQKPSSEWGIPQLEEIFPSDAALIEPYNGITIEADEFIHTYQSLDEMDQNVMKEILQFCREHQLDNEYRFIRTFLSNSDNAVIDSFSLLKNVSDYLTNNKLIQSLYECYEPLPGPISNYRKCPHCGWTLQYRNGSWYCNKENVCHKIENFERRSKFQLKENDKIFRLTSGIQRYVLLPGLQEIRFSTMLAKKGYEVTTYPEIDLFDIRIILPDKIIDLDMKDYRSPIILADYFNQLPPDQLEKYHENSFVVIPSYRCHISPAYIEMVKQRLDESVKKYIRIYSENNILQQLKEEMN